MEGRNDDERYKNLNTLAYCEDLLLKEHFGKWAVIAKGECTPKKTFEEAVEFIKENYPNREQGIIYKIGKEHRVDKIRGRAFAGNQSGSVLSEGDLDDPVIGKNSDYLYKNLATFYSCQDLLKKKYSGKICVITEGDCIIFEDLKKAVETTNRNYPDNAHSIIYRIGEEKLAPAAIRLGGITASIKYRTKGA